MSRGRRRNYGWSQQGTKNSRRKKRQSRRKQWFYVVVEGHRDGIFIKWKNAKAQVEGYPDNLHKKFDNLPDAVKWFNENRRSPPNVRTPFPPHDNTPLPPLMYNPQYDALHIDYDETSYDLDVDVPPYVVLWWGLRQSIVPRSILCARCRKKSREIRQTSHLIRHPFIVPTATVVSVPASTWTKGSPVSKDSSSSTRNCQLWSPMVLVRPAQVRKTLTRQAPAIPRVNQ